MDFIKEKNVKFSLADKEPREKITIWSEYTKRSTPKIGQDGQPMKFPIIPSDDALIYDVQGSWYRSSDAAKMKQADFKNKFPDFGLQKQFNYNVFLNGDFQRPAILPARQSVHILIENELKKQKNMGVEWNEILFEQKFDNAKNPKEKYALDILGKVDLTQAPTSEHVDNRGIPTPVENPSIVPPKPVEDKPVVPEAVNPQGEEGAEGSNEMVSPPTEDEQKVIEAIKIAETEGELKVTEEQFVNTMIKNSTSDEARAKDLFKLHK